jgi:glycosyltransferase involved in cell wall biosynthesis
MLDLAAEIKKRTLPWRLKIIGVSHLTDERTAAERRIANEELDTVIDRVGWDAYVPWHDIAAAYQAAHIGLALFEPLQNHRRSILSKFYEYIYFSLPVICSDFPLWEAFFAANGCGITVNSTEPQAIVERITRLIDSGEFDRIAARTQACRTRYLWAQMEPRLLDVYADLLGAPNRGAEPSSHLSSSV